MKLSAIYTFCFLLDRVLSQFIVVSITDNYGNTLIRDPYEYCHRIYARDGNLRVTKIKNKGEVIFNGLMTYKLVSKPAR
jgi:hypothetical protein